MADWKVLQCHFAKLHKSFKPVYATLEANTVQAIVSTRQLPSPKLEHLRPGLTDSSFDFYSEAAICQLNMNETQKLHDHATWHQIGYGIFFSRPQSTVVIVILDSARCLVDHETLQRFRRFYALHLIGDIKIVIEDQAHHFLEVALDDVIQADPANLNMANPADQAVNLLG